VANMGNKSQGFKLIALTRLRASTWNQIVRNKIPTNKKAIYPTSKATNEGC